MSMSQPIRILFVEDDPGTAMLFRKTLTRLGYRVDLAGDGEQGFTKWLAGSYHVLVTDHDIPRKKGLELIRELAASGPLPPTVMITGHGNETIAVEAMKLGADDYIMKDPEGRYLDLVPQRIADAITRRRIQEEKLKAENALRESEDKFRNLFNNAEVGMFRAGLDGSEMLDMNQKFLDILGFTREEMQGKPPAIRWADPHQREEMLRRLNTDGRCIDFECKILNKQHEERICVMSLNLYREEGVLEGSIIDITDRKRSEELAKQAARLRAVANLSSGVAHHFNNLLQIIMGNTSLSLMELESGNLSGIKTNLEHMLEATRLGAETVKRLQTFATIRADVTERESDVFDVATTARNAAEISKTFWKTEPQETGMKIDLQLDLKGGCLVRGRENEMFEVFVNLMKNATEALPHGGAIGVTTYKATDEVVITVRDTGTGIAEPDLNRVFQPFWSSKGVGIGKGMGLAVSHGLVKRHGGTISVESAVGKGTTFTIRLPLSRESVRKPEKPSTSAADDHLTILVIDDDLNIATLLASICAKAGHRVFKTVSGQEGLAIFDKERVNLVLCALGMQGMNGWDVCKAIRSVCRNEGIPKPAFVLLTGWGGQELEKEKIAESGIDAVVAKPIDSATVLTTIQGVASRFKLRSRDS